MRQNPLINNVLGMKASDGQETLADYYQTESQNGDYSFTVRTVNTSGLSARPDLQALQAQLHMAVVPDVPPSAATEVVLSPELETLRQSVQEKLSAVLSVDVRQSVKQTADDTAGRLWDKIRQAAEADAGGSLKITGMEALPAKNPLKNDDIVLKVTGEATDGSRQVTTVILSKDELDIAEPDIQGAFGPDEASYAAGYGAYLKSLGLYSLLTSLTGLITAAGQGDVKGEAISGTFVAMSVSDIAGLTDRLANRFAGWAGIAGTEAFGGGLAGLMGKGASELAGLAGLGAAAAGTVGKLVADAPLLQSAVLGFTLYSDVMALKDADGSEVYNRAVGTLTTDVVTGGVALGVGIAGMAGAVSTEVAGGVGGFLAAIGILIDVIIEPDNPMGFRTLFNRRSLALESFIKDVGKDGTDNPGDLYTLRTLPAVAGGPAQQVLSFIVSARDLPDVRTLLDDSETAVLLPLMNGLSAQEQQACSADAGVLVSTLQNRRGTVVAAQELSDTAAQQVADSGGVSSEFDLIVRWKSLVDAAYHALNQANVSDDERLSYLLAPDAPLPRSASNGDLNITLDEDGQGFTADWVKGASYAEGVTLAYGPEKLNPRHAGLEQPVDAIIMGGGTTPDINYRAEDVGRFNIGTWPEGHKPRVNEGVYPDAAYDLNEASSDPKVVHINYRFTITGNDRGNRFYSQWTAPDPDTGYVYNVNGGGGDDTLFLSECGQYTFNGGSGGTNWVVASATKRPDADYTLFDMQPDTPLPLADPGNYSWHKNFSLTMMNVANIQGSDNNEMFRGDDRSNTILTGGGNNVVWLSSGGDRYGVSGSVQFYGEAGRKADAPRDMVMLSKVNLADLTLGDKQLSGAGVQVTTDDLAQEQLVFVTEDKHSVYAAGGHWVTVLAVPDLLHAPSLNLALYDGARRLGLLEQVLLPTTSLPRTLNLCEGASGLQAILQYDANGNVTTAMLLLSENFTALTVDNMKTYSRLVAGIDDTQWHTQDNVLFRRVKQTAADGSTQQVLVINHIDAPTGAGQPSLTLPDGNALGADMVVADVTGLVQSGPSQDNGLLIGANPAASTLLRYRTTQPLTAGALSSLKWINEDDKRFTLLLPDSRKISTGNAASLKQFVLSLSDAQGNTLEGDFSAGVLTQAVFTLKQSFDGGLDTVGLSAQSDALSAGGGRLVVKTQDGVTFRFVRQAGEDGKPQLTVVVDAVDTVAYKAAHDPHVRGGTLPFGTGQRLPGVDVLLANVTALVQASGLTEAIVAQSGLTLAALAALKVTLVQLGTTLASQKAVYHYRTAQVMSAQTLGALRWQAGVSPDLWLLDLQDGNGVYVSRSVALAALTLVISDAKGSEWQINYDDAYTPPQMMQAVDAKGLSPFAVIQGVLTAVYDGDAAQKTGVSIDLSQPVQGESVAGVTQVSGSAYADVLSGNGQSVVLSGGGGNDVLSAGGGVALLVGGAGADTYVVKPGDNVVISAQGNGTATDTLVFAGQDTGALSFALKDDDLVVSSADRVAVLKNWAKGDNHYSLSGADGLMDEPAFRSLVQDSLALPGQMKALSAQYAALAQRNAALAQVVTQVPLDAGKWRMTSTQHSGGLYAGTAEISVMHNFGVRRPVRKTIVERTVK